MLYDQLLHPDEIVPIQKSEQWNDLITIFKHRSLKTILLQYYMSMNPISRIRYRMMEDVFRNNNKTSTVFIEIRKEHLPKEEKQNIIKKTGKFIAKVLSLGLLDKK
jgi:hypothetical protein